MPTFITIQPLILNSSIIEMTIRILPYEYNTTDAIKMRYNICLLRS